MLLKQLAFFAFSLALLMAGNNNPDRMAMIAITTRSSINVKALLSVRDEGAIQEREFTGLRVFNGFSPILTQSAAAKQGPNQMVHAAAKNPKPTASPVGL